MPDRFSSLVKHQAFLPSMVFIASLVGMFIAQCPPSVEKEYDRVTRGVVNEYGPFDLAGATYQLNMRAPELPTALRTNLGRDHEVYAVFSVSLHEPDGDEVYRDSVRLNLEYKTRRVAGRTEGRTRDRHERNVNLHVPESGEYLLHITMTSATNSHTYLVWRLRRSFLWLVLGFALIALVSLDLTVARLRRRSSLIARLWGKLWRRRV